MEKVESNGPLYEAISKLDGFVKEEDKSRRFTVTQCMFVVLASVFCGLATYSTLDNTKQLFIIDR